MIKIKEPSVADIFYSSDYKTLKNQLDSFKKNAFIYKYKTRAVIVPHAGLVYSGALAYKGISQLDGNIKNIFIFAPAHKVPFAGLSLTSYDEWKTPLGNIQINQEVNKELEKEFYANFYDEAFREEHSCEIEVPIIQHIFDKVKIIPVLIGNQTPDKIKEIIEKYYKNPEFGFIISSDLSHFLSDNEARKIDFETANMIETGNIDNFNYKQACGAVGICGLVSFANNLKFSLIRIGMMNSSDKSNDKTRVVGYGAWLLYENSKNNFIKKYYSEYIIKLCKDVILSKFNNNTIKTNHVPVFEQKGACFVTLNKNDSLRGCIGSIIAHRPLIEDLIRHCENSAFKDSRFEPVTKKEVNDLTINVSLLSSPMKIEFKNEQDLLNQIIAFKDGVIIKDRDYQAVYLPSVWEQIPKKDIFLMSLKMKAGLKPDHFSDTFEAYKFETEYIK